MHSPRLLGESTGHKYRLRLCLVNDRSPAVSRGAADFFVTMYFDKPDWEVAKRPCYMGDDIPPRTPDYAIQ